MKISKLLCLGLLGAGPVLASAAEPAAPAAPAAPPPPDLELVRTALGKYVETRQLISREKQDWDLGKEILQQRLALVQKEIQATRDKITEAQANISEADKKREELLAQNATLKEATAGLAEQIGGLEQGVAALLRQSPEFYQEKLRTLSVRLPADPASAKQSLSERYQNVIGLLNELTKFSRTVQVASELRSLPGGVTAEVKSLYLGLGAAYYVTAKGDAAGRGRPGPQGWTWEPANELAPRIAEAIAMFQNEKIAGFVPLPVEIQ